MELERRPHFPPPHEASLKKVRKVKQGFSDVATLHFQSYRGCDSPAERHLLSPGATRGRMDTQPAIPARPWAERQPANEDVWIADFVRHLPLLRK